MRTLCPNLDRIDGLETVLEVPIPEEMFINMGSNAVLRWHNLRALMKAQSSDDKFNRLNSARSNNEFMTLLKLVGSPLIPLQIHLDHTLSRPIRDGSVGASIAKYIVQQYVAASGGLAALNAANSMYAVGQVRMVGSTSHRVHDSLRADGENEVGGFVIWQKNPDLWYLELIVSGFKISSGSDGKVAWSQSSSQSSHANKGPPRPLRRFFQGLDPRYVASLFQGAECVEDQKSMNDEECFVLKLETNPEILKAQNTPNVEIVRHTIWGYFSQRTGSLVQFDDKKLVRMKSSMKSNSNNNSSNDNVFWETSIESTIEDYRYVEGINIAHAGRTTARLYRYGEAHNHKRKIEEHWTIEEVDFNICGLSMDCFLPPSDTKREGEGGGDQSGDGETPRNIMK